MKLSKFNTVSACNQPSTLSLRDPFTREVIVDEKGKTLDIYVYGLQSDVARSARKERDRKFGKDNELTEDQKEQVGSEFLAAITHGWSDNIEDDNGVIKYSRQSAAALYRAEDWVASQVTSFFVELSNFDPKRSRKSPAGLKS